MEYQVTATRRRPQCFEDLVGQDFVAATLQKSIEAGKIAHAYLFSGPRGCGKTSSARILAKALNCTDGPKAVPCGVCSTCIEITSGSCLDVIEIDGASNTSVNDVRKIKDEVVFPPNSGRYKIYIIDEVHMLSTSAFNALLKTIEEPPPYIIFIFATTELHKVPATIKSRCQQFNFRLVSVELLKETLSAAAEEMNIQADEEALYWIAREATGSVRDAYTLFDQVAAFSDGHITFEKIRDKLGLTGIDSINKIMSACIEKDGCTALTALDGILQKGVSVEQFVIDCTDYFRSLLFVKQGITKESLIGQKAERFPHDVINGWSTVQIEQALGLMLQLYRDIRFSADSRYELELAISRLAWLKDYVSSAELKACFEQAKNLLSFKSIVPNTQAVVGGSNYKNNFIGQETLSEAVQSLISAKKKTSDCGTVKTQAEKDRQSSGQITDMAELQKAVSAALKTDHGMLALTLERTESWSETSGIIKIESKNTFDLSMLRKSADLIKKTLSSILNRNIGVEFSSFKQDISVSEQKMDLVITQDESSRFPKTYCVADFFRGKVIRSYYSEEKDEEDIE